MYGFICRGGWYAGLLISRGLYRKLIFYLYTVYPAVYRDMWPYILCSCGRDIGSIYDVFKLMRISKYSEALSELDDDVDPAILCIIEDIRVELGDVLNSLKIFTMCCRVKLITQVEFKSLY